MPKKESKEARIEKCMETLQCSYEEAVKVVEDDDTIDAGGRCDWEEEMTPEQKKAVRKARQADRTVSTGKTKRTRATDDDKRRLLADIKILLEGLGADVEVVNAERELDFIFNDRKLKIVLSAPRGSNKKD